MFSKIKIHVATVLLALGLVTSLGLIVSENSSNYTRQDYWQRYPELKKSFESSQYVNKNPDGWVPDEVVYAYAGGAFIQGINPVLILPEVSALGKYIIGLSTVLFNNENIVIMLIMGFGAVISMIVLSRQIFSNITISLLPPLLLSFEPLFRNQFKYVPHMDIAQMCFLLWSFVLFNKARSTSRTLFWFILTAIFIGLFISTKFYISGATIVAAMSLVLLLNHQWHLFKIYVLTLPIAILVLLTTYIRAFAFGYTLFPFLGIQRWIFEYHTGKIDKVGSVWPLIYLNQWYVWWGDKPILNEFQWRFTWPLTVTFSLLGSILALLKKIKLHANVQVLFAFTATYLAFLSLGQTTARYLVILQPVIYILSVYMIIEATKYFKQKIMK